MILRDQISHVKVDFQGQRASTVVVYISTIDESGIQFILYPVSIYIPQQREYRWLDPTVSSNLVTKMSTSQADVTFDRYVLNFRDELQSAARDCLTSLELQIKDEGDDWLEAHIESLFSTSK